MKADYHILLAHNLEDFSTEELSCFSSSFFVVALQNSPIEKDYLVLPSSSAKRVHSRIGLLISKSANVVAWISNNKNKYTNLIVVLLDEPTRTVQAVLKHSNISHIMGWKGFAYSLAVKENYGSPQFPYITYQVVLENIREVPPVFISNTPPAPAPTPEPEVSNASVTPAQPSNDN